MEILWFFSVLGKRLRHVVSSIVNFIERNVRKVHRYSRIDEAIDVVDGLQEFNQKGSEYHSIDEALEASGGYGVYQLMIHLILMFANSIEVIQQVTSQRLSNNLIEPCS